MKKINRKIHNAYCRYRFWYSLTEHIITFNKLLQVDELSSSEDIRTLNKIHSLLFESYKLAQDKRDVYSQIIDTLIGA